MKISRIQLKKLIKEELEEFSSDSAENPYNKLEEAYHILEDAVADYPQLQGALDSIANVLDSLDAGDSSGTGAYFE